MIKKIGTVGIYVADQKAAEAFWIEKVGFEKRLEMDMGNGSSWLEVAAPGAQSCLVIYPKSLMPDWEDKKPSVVFHCEDIDGTCERLKGNGVAFSMELQDMAWGKFAAFKDPDGNEFGLKEIQ